MYIRDYGPFYSGLYKSFFLDYYFFYFCLFVYNCKKKLIKVYRICTIILYTVQLVFYINTRVIFMCTALAVYEYYSSLLTI